MILLIGASGYVGRAFARELCRRDIDYAPLSRRTVDYTDFNRLFSLVRRSRPTFIINAAGYTGGANPDSCESARAAALAANTLLPLTITRVCLMTNTPWGHVSSGNIYTGAKLIEHGQIRIEKNLNQPELRRLLAEHPECFFGFTEWDEPNFTFRCAPSNFYSGTKALAEEMIRGHSLAYIWRPGLPFDSREEVRNLLWQMQQNGKLCDTLDTVTHVGDFARACLDLWERQSPYGIYHVVNPGVIARRELAEMIHRILNPDHGFEFGRSEDDYHDQERKTAESHCILDAAKLLATGVEMRPAKEALVDALENWREAVSPLAALH
jgi:UDP-glucose 4,6-dehydratase